MKIKILVKLILLVVIVLSGFSLLPFMHANIASAQAILRVDAAQSIYNTFSLPAYSCSGQAFTDTSSPFVNALYQAGITSGCGGSLYCPTRNLTKNEAAHFLNQLANFLPSSSDYVSQKYNDVTYNPSQPPLQASWWPYHYFAINLLHPNLKNILSPDSNNNFNPTADIQSSIFTNALNTIISRNNSSVNRISINANAINGNATGTINNSDGVVHEVQVKVDCGNWNSLSFSNGQWSLPNLTPGTHTVYARAIGNNPIDPSILPTLAVTWKQVTVTQPQTLVCSPANQTKPVNGLVDFSATGGNGTYSWSGGDVIVSPTNLSNYSVVFTSVGNRYVTVTSGGQSSQCQVTVTQSPPCTTCGGTNPTVSLIANPTSITSGQSSTLTWGSQNATSCSITQLGGVALSGSQAVYPTSTTTYTITCNGTTGTTPATAQATVTVNQIQNPTVTLTASSTNIQLGQNTTLTWSSQNATSCSAYWTTSTAVNGSGVVVPTTAGATTYSITCYSSTGQQASASVTINATQIQSPAVNIVASPLSVSYGGSTYLTWNSTNTTSCTANSSSSQWSGTKTTSGSNLQITNLTANTTFSINCVGTNGTTVSDSVQVLVGNQILTPTVTLSANPTTINNGANSTLTWSSTNATSCSAYWTTSTAVNGSGVVVPTVTTTYSITCSSSTGQQASASTTVYVNNNNTTQPPIVNLTASQTYVTSGNSTYINWNPTNNPTYCTGSNGTNGWSGSRNTYSSNFSTGALYATTTFAMTCGNSAGSNTEYVTVNVNNVVNQTCQDPNASNYGGSLPCNYYTQVCQDVNAINYRGTLPCRYNTYNYTCQDMNAINYRGSLPCVYQQINNQPTVGISADSTNLAYNGSTNIRWYTTNATSCYASGGSIGWAGVKSIGPGNFYTGSLNGTKTYTITCTNSYGSASDSVTVYVRGQTYYNPVPTVAPSSYVVINSSVDRNQPIVPTIDNTRPRPGDQINYTVNYQNVGTGSITGLVLRMNLPYEVDYMFSTPNNPIISGNNLTFNLGTLKANAQGTVTVRVRVRDNIPAGTNLNFPATLSYIDPSGYPQTVNANVAAQVYTEPTTNTSNTNTSVNNGNIIPLGANVFGAGFLPNNLFGWLLLLILILLLVLLGKYLFGSNSTKKTTTVTTH